MEKTTTSKIELSSTVKGRQAELIAMTACISLGWTVLEPISAETFDFAVTKPDTHEINRVQVKTIAKRERNGTEYYVIKGRRNTGNPYTFAETDFFAGVVDGKVYIVANAEQSEYWAQVTNADEQWMRIDVQYE